MAEFADAMDAGVKGAYQAVMNPTEGTILSVMRAASECAAQLVEIDPEGDFETLFVAAITAADAALDKTPEQLPKLKEAGVVDAGGYGFLGILNAMNEVLKGGFVPGARSRTLSPTASLLLPLCLRRRSPIRTVLSASWKRAQITRVRARWAPCTSSSKGLGTVPCSWTMTT